MALLALGDEAQELEAQQMLDEAVQRHWDIGGKFADEESMTDFSWDLMGLFPGGRRQDKAIRAANRGREEVTALWRPRRTELRTGLRGENGARAISPAATTLLGIKVTHASTSKTYTFRLRFEGILTIVMEKQPEPNAPSDMGSEDPFIYELKRPAAPISQLNPLHIQSLHPCTSHLRSDIS
ncbi:hypothetical protein INS49_013610 [Diaporthe citri]|uniref:uncharacterized protein n=1 Tax=Diaporthe citri TaxID=83186 RepID=UPI001C81D95D|nr:uncharacterized protein INS49_013610 [Diaporthe citri]KAG6357731.1 hypothetical protein INS49_013610 [Diaporthe citri]